MKEWHKEKDSNNSNNTKRRSEQKKVTRRTFQDAAGMNDVETEKRVTYDSRLR